MGLYEHVGAPWGTDSLHPRLQAMAAVLPASEAHALWSVVSPGGRTRSPKVLWGSLSAQLAGLLDTTRNWPQGMLAAQLQGRCSHRRPPAMSSTASRTQHWWPLCVQQWGQWPP